MEQSAEELVEGIVARAREVLAALGGAPAPIPTETAELLAHCQAVVDYAEGRRPDMMPAVFHAHLKAVVVITGEAARRVLEAAGKVFDDVEQRRELEQLRAAFGGGSAEGRA